MKIVQKLHPHQKLNMKLLLMKHNKAHNKQIHPTTLSNTSILILRIKSLEVKKVPEEQDHTSDKKNL